MSIKRESLVTIAINSIKEHIVDQNYQPGDKFLPEKELVDRLQVSRTVVREALISLQSVGLIKINPGDGVYIANPDMDPIKEILKHQPDINGVKLKELADIRKVIELGAVRLIIENDIKVDFSQAYKLNDLYFDAVINDKDTRENDRLFHQFLIKSTNNQTFYHFSEIIHEYFTVTKIDLIKSKRALLRSYEEHKQIIQALETKDMAVAQYLVIDHLKPILTFVEQLEDVT